MFYKRLGAGIEVSFQIANSKEKVQRFHFRLRTARNSTRSDSNELPLSTIVFDEDLPLVRLLESDGADGYDRVMAEAVA